MIIKTRAKLINYLTKIFNLVKISKGKAAFYYKDLLKILI